MIKVLPEGDNIPLLVLTGGAGIMIIDIPRMSEDAFEFFLRMLDTYKPAIVIQESEDSSDGQENEETE